MNVNIVSNLEPLIHDALSSPKPRGVLIDGKVRMDHKLRSLVEQGVISSKERYSVYRGIEYGIAEKDNPLDDDDAFEIGYFLGTKLREGMSKYL